MSDTKCQIYTFCKNLSQAVCQSISQDKCMEYLPESMSDYTIYTSSFVPGQMSDYMREDMSEPMSG